MLPVAELWESLKQLRDLPVQVRKRLFHSRRSHHIDEAVFMFPPMF